MIPVDDPQYLSLLFHLNSEPWLNDEAYRRGAPEPEPPLSLRVMERGRAARADVEPAARPAEQAPLVSDVSPCGGAGTGRLGRVGGRVRSTASRPDQHTPTATRRAAPSAGGLYPLELPLVLRRIDGLDDGVYRYDSRGHTLDLVRGGDQFASLLQTSLYAYPFIENANGLIVMATVFSRTQRKVRASRLPVPAARGRTRGPEPVPRGDTRRLGDAVHRRLRGLAAQRGTRPGLGPLRRPVCRRLRARRNPRRQRATDSFGG